MKIILTGPPASGKGTQGDKLCDEFGVPSISVGALLRDLPKDHPRYRENKEISDSGGLSPDDLVADLVKERLSHEDCKKGYILDGYGRRLNQIRIFEPELDAVILINIPEEETLKRISGRRMCTTDGEIYNIYTLPKEELEKCRGDLIQRDDDKEEVVRERLIKYKNETQPMIDHYIDKGILYEIDGTKNPDTVYADIKALLSSLKLI